MTRSAAEAFLQGDVDKTACAVLDVRLPGMSGRDLQRRLIAREQPAVVFVSAHTSQRCIVDEIIAESGIENGADGDRKECCFTDGVSS